MANFKAYIVNDIIQERENNINQRLEPLAPELEGIANSDLRWDDSTGVVVNANTKTNFFIDDDGIKHLQNYADGAFSVTGVFTLNRRAAGDRFERDTGSFIDDGFTVGAFVSVEGSASNDQPFKVITVEANRLYTDMDFSRISPDENDITVTIHQGWQRLSGINFSDIMGTTAFGRWRVKPVAELQDDAFLEFSSETDSLVQQHVTEQTPYPERHRNPPEYLSAIAKIVDITKDESPPYGFGHFLSDVNRFGQDIYIQRSAQTTDATASITFDAVGGKIVRSEGSFGADGWKRIMVCTVTGSASNNKKFAVKNATNGELLISADDTDKLVDEGPSTGTGITLDGLSAITGYESFRNSDNPGVVAKENWRRAMQEGVAVRWFDDVADIENSYIKKAENADVWATSTLYSVDQVVFDPKTQQYFICIVEHTSGTGTIQDDITNWNDYLPDGIVLPDYPTVQIAS